MDDWKKNLVQDPAGIREILKATKRIAVLGMKTEEQADQPAVYVPQSAIDAGYEVIPVLVYYPEVTEVLGRKVYRKVADVPPPVDMVNVFRRPQDIPPHLDDILAAKPKFVWFQLGITNDAAAERLARAGIKVVQDRCLMVELRRLR
ncbi:MAG TPA: CoA-binding protein [bacterium]|nr:CoA-binding protein [bacterium]